MEDSGGKEGGLGGADRRDGGKRLRGRGVEG